MNANQQPKYLHSSNRVLEQFDTLKAEFENLLHDVNLYKAQRDDYDRKLQAQVTELNSMQQTLFELEKNYSKMKQQYEDEIAKLRKQLNSGNIDAQKSTVVVDSLPNLVLKQNGNTTEKTLSNSNNSIKRNRDPAEGSNTESQASQATGSTSGTKHVKSENSSKTTPPTTTAATPTATATTSSSSTSSQIPEPPPTTRAFQVTGENFQVTYHATVTNPNTNNTNNNNNNSSNNNNNQRNEVIAHGVNGVRVSLVNSYEHDSVVCCVKISPDGTLMATGANAGAYLYAVPPPADNVTNNSNDTAHVIRDMTSDGSLPSSVALHKYTPHTPSVLRDREKEKEREEEGEGLPDLYIRALAFSPNGEFVACGAEDKLIRIWRTKGKRNLCGVLSGHDLDIYSLDFNPQGTLIVSGSGDKRAKIWKVDDWLTQNNSNENTTEDQNTAEKDTSVPEDIFFTPAAQQQMATRCVATLWSEEVGARDGVTSVAFSPDGKKVATGSLDRIVRLYDAETGYFLERYEGHTDAIYAVQFSPDSKTLLSASLDKTLKLWDLQSPVPSVSSVGSGSGSSVGRQRARCRGSFGGHRDYVLSAAFTPDGSHIISASKDRTIQFWDIRTQQPFITVLGHKNSVISVSMGPLGSPYFASGSGDYKAVLWRYQSKKKELLFI